MAHEIHTWPTSGTHPQLLIRLLTTVLPSSLPLLRRVQFPYNSTTATLLTTFPPCHNSTTFPVTFAVGYFDRSNAPNVQAWIFSSLELSSRSESTSASRNSVDDETSINQFLALFAHFHSSYPPPQVRNQTPEHHQDIILVAAVHSTVAAALRSLGGGIVRDDVGGLGGPYRKYVFSPLQLGVVEDERLPHGMRWDVVRPGNYQLVMQTNALVRSSSMLDGLPSVAIRCAEGQSGGAGGDDGFDEKAELVAWGFLGVDGSVRTLYCMPAYRRLGLARKIVVRLVSNELGKFGDGDLAHVDVASENLASVGLFEALGFEYKQDSYWLRIDLARC